MQTIAWLNIANEEIVFEIIQWFGNDLFQPIKGETTSFASMSQPLDVFWHGSSPLIQDDTFTQERMKDPSDPGPTTPRTPEDFCVNVSPPRAPRSGLERAYCGGSEADGGIKFKVNGLALTQRFSGAKHCSPYCFHLIKFLRNLRRRPTSATRRRLSLSPVEETPRRPGKNRRGQRKVCRGFINVHLLIHSQKPSNQNVVKYIFFVAGCTNPILKNT